MEEVTIRKPRPLVATKKVLARSVRVMTGIPVTTSRKVIDAFLRAIREELQHGRAVKCRHFGYFDVRGAPERKGRNPKTGETVYIPARRRLVFRPADEMQPK